MATRSELRDWVREQTLLETDDWPNAKLDIILNEGIYEVAARFNWPWLASMATLVTVVDQMAYTFDSISGAPPYIAKIASVIDPTQRVRLTEISPHMAWERYGGDYGSGDASYFYVWGTSIYLIAVPDDIRNIEVYYYKRPTLMANDSDTPEWDPLFHYAIAKFAAMRVWEREEDFEKAADYRNQFDSSIEAMARFYLNRVEDYPLIMSEGSRAPIYRDPNMPFLT